MVGGLQGREAPGTGTRGSGTELRFAGGCSAGGSGERRSRRNAIQSVPERKRERGYLHHSGLAQWRNALAGGICTAPKPNVWSLHAELALVRNRHLGPVAPLD